MSTIGSGTSLYFFYLFAVPQQGELDITTEFGKMTVRPNEICVIQVRPLSSIDIIIIVSGGIAFSHNDFTGDLKPLSCLIMRFCS